MKAISKGRAAEIEETVRSCVPGVRFGREYASWASPGGTVKALRRLEAYAYGGVIVVSPVTVTVDDGDGIRERYDAIRFDAKARNGETRRWDASGDMTGMVVEAARLHLIAGRKAVVGKNRKR